MADLPGLDDIIETFDFLDDPDDRIAYVIELGRRLPTLPADKKNPANKVDGCVSQVWLIATREEGPPCRLHFEADSDAFLVRGLIAILMGAFSGRTPREILDADVVSALDRVGLTSQITVNRRNGLASMVSRIHAEARQANSPT